MNALIGAPDVEVFWRDDLITLPPDHVAYAWQCVVPVCLGTRAHRRELCESHLARWWKVRDAGGTSLHQFVRTAPPAQTRGPENPTPDPCRICPGRPSHDPRLGLCRAHVNSWRPARRFDPGLGFDVWLTRQRPLPGYAACAVPKCGGLACDALGLCSPHRNRYRYDGSPGGGKLPGSVFRSFEARGLPVPVTFVDRQAFTAWCAAVQTVIGPGQLDLRGLPPLVAAEIRWGLIAHARRPNRAVWRIRHLREVIALARGGVASIFDEDITGGSSPADLVLRGIRRELQLVYLTPANTKEAGFVCFEHFGVNVARRGNVYDLTSVTQRWLRDLLWEEIVELLQCASPPRSGSPLDYRRRALIELSAFLEATRADGGHEPSALQRDDMLRFVADQRRRAADGLPSLVLRDSDGTPAVVNENTRHYVFNNIRMILRKAMDNGVAEQLGLDREFIVAMPAGGKAVVAKRRPFDDDVARALTHPDNLRVLAADYDPYGYGFREIWETVIATGRRCREILELRQECLGRYGGVPMLWHDQTKVGHLDAAIRIPETVYEALRRRQDKTLAGFEERHGRPATPAERQRMALFPSRVRNPDGRVSIGYSVFGRAFRDWVDTLDVGHPVPHQARHTLATSLLRAGAGLHHIKKYLGHVSLAMAEHYAEVASSELDDILQHVWVAGPAAAQPGRLLSAPNPSADPAALRAMAVDLSRRSTPAEGGFCTFQPVVRGEACPWQLNCEGCDKFVLSGADLLYWRRKREQWRSLAERAPDDATADWLHQVFEPTARAIDGLETALADLGLLEQALAMDYRRPQDYFHRIWSTAFRATELAQTASHQASNAEQD
ncbi:site-specific integrase [Dactylosporangium sp. NBC_01737]|uniref:tyrosine-type recombinase/integrase n=1 Tax=Dactylosporangium sp. NBC_01737 TaxID=2975959 RepID=UPI002E0F25A2|nr:site-specific integrase [Dactylosporangium sp. NBC_01737]